MEKESDESDKMKDLRYERKFAISELSSREVEHAIKHNPAIFSEIFYERTVNNIYLDSLNFKSYNENIEGISQKLKIRVRWYGKMFGPIINPMLELKIKDNELGRKLSFKLKPFILGKNFSSKLLQKVFLKSNLPEWLTEKLKLYVPTLLNSYRRKYFISANKKHRITLDWDLIFFKIGNKNKSFNEKIIDKEICILEIKYPLKNYEETGNITKHFPFRLTAYSKYIVGINLLNL